jgi:hypothetical protein
VQAKPIPALMPALSQHTRPFLSLQDYFTVVVLKSPAIGNPWGSDTLPLQVVLVYADCMWSGIGTFRSCPVGSRE